MIILDGVWPYPAITLSLGPCGTMRGERLADLVIYTHTKIDGEWIENANIVPEDGAASDYSGTSVAIPGSTALFGAPDAGEENGGSTYVVDLCVPR